MAQNSLRRPAEAGIPQPQKGVSPSRPHGCLTAFVIGVALLIPFAIGFAWIGGLFNPDALFLAGAAGVYALILLVPFSLIALGLRQEHLSLWRGVALTLALAGGHAALTGGLLALDVSLPWPGVPAAVSPLVSLVYGLVILLAGRRYFLNRPSAGPMLLGVGLGVLVSGGWVFVGAPGTLTEALLALLEAAASGLIAALLTASPFFYDRKTPAQHPFWAAVLAGATFTALTSGLLAARGYWLQGMMLGTALIPTGFIAGGLLTLDEKPDPRRLWWAALAFFFIVFLLPFGWTEGFEGEWMMEDMLSAWGPALGAELLLGLPVSIAVLAMRRRLVSLSRRPAIPLAFSGAVAALAAVLYVGFGRPGLQPDTFFVVMAEQADTSFAREIEDRTARVEAVYETLTTHALASQADLRAFLDERGVRYTPYYLVNGLEVEGSPFLRRQIEARDDVARVLNSPHARPLPSFAQPVNLGMLTLPKPDRLAWGVDEIDAEIVWEQPGTRGEGIIVGHADSGVDWTHPALHDQYLGVANGTGSHDYTWFDPWYGTTEPVDTGGHGTHTLGSILGADGIGVAPGAQWIACRNLARNLGNPAYYLDCMQFLFAPHPQNGDPFTEGDPTRGAHVTNNSWGCPPEEGCDGLTLAIAVEHLYNAGQMFVVSAGNDGPDCSTVDPPATAEAAFSVGAIDPSGTIAFFSSRGPVLVDGSGRVKPDVTAPGVSIVSAAPEGGYGEASGTSMAGPHVTGLVALMWSANPELIGEVDLTEAIITGTAHYIPAGNLCGGDDGERNNVYGYGRVDAWEAVEAAVESAQEPVP